jgi:hypothetical protein
VTKKGKRCLFLSPPIFTYGAENWTWSKVDIRVMTAEMTFLRSRQEKLKERE